MYGHPVYFVETFIDPGAIPRDLLPRGKLDAARQTTGRGKDDLNTPAEPLDQGSARIAADPEVSRIAEPVIEMKRARRQRVEINIEELDRLVDRTREGAVERRGSREAQDALHALAQRCRCEPRSTEKTRAVIDAAGQDSVTRPTEPLRGERKRARKGTRTQQRRRVSQAQREWSFRTRISKSGDGCPECAQGKVYSQKEPKVLVRIVGQAPLAGDRLRMERLRCNACGQVFTAEEPEGIGAEKYDETAAAMIAQLKYGSGVPFMRLERLEPTGDSIAGSDAVGNRRRGGGTAQARLAMN